MDNILLTIENLDKYYGEQKALHNICLSIEKGAIYGLIGQNGAGKTTLIRILNKIIDFDKGQVLLKSKPIRSNDVRYIGYLPEERGLYKNMSIQEQALYFGQLKGMTKAEANTQLNYWLDRFDIADWRHKKVQDLSKGMAQKVQFIITVLHQPELLILDEPFSGFDPVNAQLIADEIKELAKKGTTVIFSSHRMESVTEMCSALCFIHKGTVLLEGDIKEIQQKYAQEIYEVSLMDFNAEQLSLLQQNSNIEIVSMVFKDNLAQLEILKREQNYNLLAVLLKAGEVTQYKQHVPTLQEIFIKTIQNA